MIQAVIETIVRAAFYGRLFDEDKDKKGQNASESIKNQITIAEQYAQERGWIIIDYYWDDDKVKVALNAKRKSGKFIGSFATYGYIKSADEKGQLLVDFEAAIIVKRIFTLYLEGYGTSKIANILNSEDIPNPTKYKEQKDSHYKNHFKKNNLGLWNKNSAPSLCLSHYT